METVFFLIVGACIVGSLLYGIAKIVFSIPLFVWLFNVLVFGLLCYGVFILLSLFLPFILAIGITLVLAFNLSR
jgi:hypothetical protein